MQAILFLVGKGGSHGDEYYSGESSVENDIIKEPPAPDNINRRLVQFQIKLNYFLNFCFSSRINKRELSVQNICE